MTFDLTTMRRNRDAGTPGEWFASPHAWPDQIGCCPLVGRPYAVATGHRNVAATTTLPDAARIASVPSLEAEIERLTAENAELRAETVRIVKATAKLIRAATVFAEGSVGASGTAVIVGFPHASNWLSELRSAIKELAQ